MSDELREKLIPDPKKERIERTLEYAKQGLTYDEIGALVDRTRQWVSQICIANGIVRRPNDLSKKNKQKFIDKDANTQS